jgi:hypothetical protein
MIKRLNAEFRDDTEQSIILDKNSSFEDIKTLMNSNPDEGIITKTKLNAENIQNAKSVFNETIQEINCGPVVSNSDVTTDVKSGGKRKKRYSKRKKSKRKRRQRKTKRIK